MVKWDKQSSYKTPSLTLCLLSPPHVKPKWCDTLIFPPVHGLFDSGNSCPSVLQCFKFFFFGLSSGLFLQLYLHALPLTFHFFSHSLNFWDHLLFSECHFYSHYFFWSMAAVCSSIPDYISNFFWFYFLLLLLS